MEIRTFTLERRTRHIDLHRGNRMSTQTSSLNSESDSNTRHLYFERLHVTSRVWLTSYTFCTIETYESYFFGTHITLISLVTVAKSCLCIRLQTPDQKQSRLRFSLPTTTPTTLIQNLHSTPACHARHFFKHNNIKYNKWYLAQVQTFREPFWRLLIVCSIVTSDAISLLHTLIAITTQLVQER